MLCSSPHPLFASHLNIFNGTFPFSRVPTPFPPSSFLHHCPNLSPSEGSCCDQASVAFTHSFINRFTAARHLLTSSFSSLTPRSLYAALTNRTLHPSRNLTAPQQSALSFVITKARLLVNQSTTCVDHWMAYLTSMLCLACDPRHAHFTRDPFPLLPPRVSLQLSTCSALYSRCGPFLLSLFEELPVLLHALMEFVYATPEYNTTDAFYLSYDVWLNGAMKMMAADVSIDLCQYRVGAAQPRTDCAHLFCQGGQIWAEASGNRDWGTETVVPHAFRGVNYAESVTSLNALLDVNAYLAFIVCLTRMAFDARAPFNPFMESPAFADGCPREGNVLHHLFPARYPYASPLSSSAMWEALHGTPREASDCRGSYVSAEFSAPRRSEASDSCNLNGFAATRWVNTTNDTAAWPAYHVGCRLNLSSLICEVGVPAADGGDGEGVDGVLRMGFIVLVCAGLLGLAGVALGLWRRMRGLREERSRDQLSEALNPEHYWDGWTRETGDGDTGGLQAHGLTYESPRHGTVQ